MEIELRSSENSVVLRNEEINRQRMANERRGGPLKITDPAAFERLMADMKLKAEQQQETERQRELERAKREGSAYKSKEQRAKEAKEAKERDANEEDQAKSIDNGKFDPSMDYYGILGIDRAAPAAEVRRAYKRFALLYHPDKHKGEGEEQQAAIAASFRQVSAAFDVLIDEERRALYDKIRDYKETNPGKGLPPLSPEEAAMMRSGIAELSRLRRQGPKLGKHPPLEQEVWISLPKLNSGCTKSVEVARRRLNYAGLPVTIPRTFHLVVRRGSKEGTRLVFENDGHETVDTEAGDMVFILRAKPHPTLRRCGGVNSKDLEMFAATITPGDVYFATEVESIGGKKQFVYGSALLSALINEGRGGEWKVEIPNAGLFDPDEPWEKPGKFIVKVRYPPVLLMDGSVKVSTALKRRSVYLVGCSDDVVGGALVAGPVGAVLRHVCQVQYTTRDDPNSSWPSSTAAVLRLTSGNTGNGDKRIRGAVGSTIAALQSLVPGLQLHDIDIPVDVTNDGVNTILDDDWVALHTADVILLDLDLTNNSEICFPCSMETTLNNNNNSREEEDLFKQAARYFVKSGLMEVMWKRAWQGACIVGFGAGCGLLGDLSTCFLHCGNNSSDDGSQSTSSSTMKLLPVLDKYMIRSGGGPDGWKDTLTTISNTHRLNSCVDTCVGVIKGSVSVVNPWTGQAEMMVSPSRQILIETATASQDGDSVVVVNSVQEADDDFGFFAAWTL